GQFVAQAALQPPAKTEEPRWIQTEVLLLGHLDRHWLEAVQPRRAAQRPATRPVAAEHLRLVSCPDLAHFDARVELGGQFANELAEIDTAFGGKVENHP